MIPSSRLCVLMLPMVFAFACKSTSSPLELSTGVPLDRNIVADKFGNDDSAASMEELQAVADYFALNDTAWCAQTCLPEVWTSTSISAEQVRASFMLRTRPYPSEQALRNAFRGKIIETPWVSVMALQQTNNEVRAIACSRSPGPTFADAIWVRLKIIE